MDLLQILELTLIGFGTGMLSGLFGVGGGFILVPLLVFIDVPIHQAIGSSLAYISCMSAYGAYKHCKAGNVHLKLATLLIIAASVSLVFIGVQLNSAFSSQTLAIAFAALLVLTATAFLVRRHVEEWEDQVNPDHVPSDLISSHWLANIALGAVIGLLSGLFGVGGGFLLVPALVLIINMPMKIAVGTSLFVIIFSSIIGTASHYMLGNVDFSLLPGLLVGGTIGIKLGVYIIHKISAKRLEFLFSILLLLAAGIMFADAFGV